MHDINHFIHVFQLVRPQASLSKLPSSFYNVFFNDLIDNINSNLENVFTTHELVLFTILYADDAVVFAKSKETLQSLLKDIELYCGIWGLKVNTKRTKVMIFERGRHTSCDLFLNNIKLEVVDSLNIWVFISLKMETDFEPKKGYYNMHRMHNIIFCHCFDKEI